MSLRSCIDNDGYECKGLKLKNSIHISKETQIDVQKDMHLLKFFTSPFYFTFMTLFIKIQGVQ